MQQSLSTISGVLNFSEHPEFPKGPATVLPPTLPKLPETNWRSNGLYIPETETFELDGAQQLQSAPSGDDKLSSPEVGVGDPSQNYSRPYENGRHHRSGSRSLFKWKSDAEQRLHKESTHIRSVLPVAELKFQELDLCHTQLTGCVPVALCCITTAVPSFQSK